MHVELADLFRCPEPHPDSWLVVAADRTERRVVLDGVLGCPLCAAEYRIENGVTYFGAANESAPVSAESDVHANAPADISDDEAMRAAALLNATDASATLGFVGASIALVRAVQSAVGARCIAFDAPDARDARHWYGASDAPLAIVVAGAAMLRDGRLLAPGALAGVWREPGAPMPLGQPRARGRLVAPAALPVPDGFTELARDAMQWVAERDAANDPNTAAPSGLTQLRRRR